MFKYIWIIIFVGIWLLWGWATVKDIIRTLQNHYYDDAFGLLDDLDPLSMAFIWCTLLILGIASFIAWLASLE